MNLDAFRTWVRLRRSIQGPHRATTGLFVGLQLHQPERQNGKIWVESEVGQGSTFYVSLPAASAM